MTTHALPIDSQHQTDELPGTINGWPQLPFPGQKEKWQIVPPIATEGRMAAVKLQHVAPQEKPVAPSQEATTSFTVNFTELERQHYSVSITVKQSPNGILVEQEQTPDGILVEQEQAPVAQSVTLGRPNVDNSEPISPSPDEQANTDGTNKNFLLQIIQPGLVGLMDGSVSTLAPIFAVAFATHQPFTTFLVGMASALGAGISMAFSEALSDDGDLTGRGNPFIRGGITGLMTFLSGAGHALPFLIPHLQLALFVAYAVVAIELLGIAAIRHKFFGTRWWLSIVQVVGGGALVFIAALLLGSA